MKPLKKPVNQKMEILYELLTNNTPLSLSQLMNHTGILCVSKRITELRRLGLKLFCLYVNTKNKHGRAVRYGTWSVNGERELGLKLYQNLNKRA